MTKVVDIAWKDAARFFEGAHERSSSQDVVVWLSCGTPHVCGPRCNDLVLTADKMKVKKPFRPSKPKKTGSVATKKK